MGLSVFGSDAPSLTSFTESEGGSDFQLADHVGATMILKVGETKTIKTNRYGEKPATEVDVIVLDGKGGGVAYDDALIFSKAIVDQLKKIEGQTTVAVVEGYESQYGTTGYKLGAPSQDAFAAAQAYVAKG